MRTFGSLLVRGLIVGLFAGLLAGAFAYATGEPRIDAAIAIEEAGGHAHTHAEEEHHDEEPLVSRDGQRAGLFLATSLYGVALGGLFAVAFTLLRRKLRTGNDAYAALGLAAAGFVGVVLVPFLKYPPNPPAVGDPETITRRTVTYLLTLVIGLLAVWAGGALSRWAERYGDLARLAGGVVGLVGTVVAAYLILPRINEVPEAFPATLLWQFRFASLGTQATLWLLLGFGYAVAVERRPSRSKVVAA
ncbi:CbtA family protein [Kribbella sp. HUAS MG21]|uniref:CbtA family protein n=1 Tax=Kribbella sp. HUAS MG21 TaxID=3160966 RepID=A0AAU7TKR9_9ACTN